MNPNFKASIFYYGVARNAKNKLERVLDYHSVGQSSRQFFTGKIYRTQKEAIADIERPNCE